MSVRTIEPYCALRQVLANVEDDLVFAPKYAAFDAFHRPERAPAWPRSAVACAKGWKQ